MKTHTKSSSGHNKWLLALAIALTVVMSSYAQDTTSYTEVKGKITESESKDNIAKATVTLMGTNLSTVSNSEGKFALKIPVADANRQLKINALGFNEKIILLPENLKKPIKIKLDYSIINLEPANLVAYTDAKALVKKVLNKRKENYLNKETVMTAFYRETIKKRTKNASLAEAVVNIYKQPNANNKKDQIQLVKSRKDTDYSKLDTIALKLQGGPFSTLYVDVMKYPEYIFSPETMDAYTFRFGKVSEINGENVFVIRFKQRGEVLTPLYEGNLYIGASSLALVKATYALKLDNTEEVNEMFVRRKPSDVKIKPRNISYEVNYREQNGRWIYGYSKANLSFEVKRKRRLFKSIYTLSSEMAITDWQPAPTSTSWQGGNEIDEYIIMADQNIGFGDPEFWGAYNVIEPEKSIEAAIKKIQRKLDRSEERASLGGK